MSTYQGTVVTSSSITPSQSLSSRSQISGAVGRTLARVSSQSPTAAAAPGVPGQARISRAASATPSWSASR